MLSGCGAVKNLQDPGSKPAPTPPTPAAEKTFWDKWGTTIGVGVGTTIVSIGTVLITMWYKECGFFKPAVVVQGGGAAANAGAGNPLGGNIVAPPADAHADPLLNNPSAEQSHDNSSDNPVEVPLEQLEQLSDNPSDSLEGDAGASSTDTPVENLTQE